MDSFVNEISLEEAPLDDGLYMDATPPTAPAIFPEPVQRAPAADPWAIIERDGLKTISAEDYLNAQLIVREADTGCLYQVLKHKNVLTKRYIEFLKWGEAIKQSDMVDAVIGRNGVTLEHVFGHLFQ